MGLGMNEFANYLTISDGKIVKKVSGQTERSVERKNKLGNTVFEEKYDHISGMITDISIREHADYGRSWNIHLVDDGEKFVLQMNYSSGYSAAFLKTLPNVDLTRPVTIIPKMSEVDGKKKATVFINQGGKALKHYYTKENPNGLPQLEKKRVKGKDTWDDSEMMEFLENMVSQDILPKLNVTAKSVNSGETEEVDF